ncbi:MAG: dGTPase [Cyclobacteriaceae bacterium]|nr:MAG: dGTPase [Cyclobacteriaceae bacterium]
MNWVKLLGGDNREPATKSDRSAFERDYDRIIFSYPFRRLQDKTQVFPLPEQDFVHTRLTHSLEVSSVGRTLGKSVGEKILERYQELDQLGITRNDFGAIVSAACLTHDLGNPPFGHTGEDAISDFFRNNPHGEFFKTLVTAQEWEDLINFEGNAQGFRILTDAKYQGLKLTEPTLAAFTKYPRPSLLENPQKNRRSQKKFGYFQTEQDTFKKLAEALGLKELDAGSWCRHPLAFLVEAADDICYHIIDLEDGCQMGLVSEKETIELFAGVMGDRFMPSKLEQIPGRNEKIGLLRAVSIGILIDQCAKVFLDHEQEILSGNFDQALTDYISSRDVLKEIIDVSIKKLYRSRIVLEIEAGGFEVLGGLLEAFTTASYSFMVHRGEISKKQLSVFSLLPDDIKQSLATERSTYQMLREILDFVSGLTDRHAVGIYRKLKGTTLSGWAG